MGRQSGVCASCGVSSRNGKVNIRGWPQGIQEANGKGGHVINLYKQAIYWHSI